MSNILQFPGKKPPAPVAAPVAAPPQNVEELTPMPAFGLLISDTAAAQLVEALGFYANQGYDGGKKARMALIGMHTVIQSTH